MGTVAADVARVGLAARSSPSFIYETVQGWWHQPMEQSPARGSLPYPSALTAHRDPLLQSTGALGGGEPLRSAHRVQLVGSPRARHGCSSLLPPPGGVSVPGPCSPELHPLPQVPGLVLSEVTWSPWEPLAMPGTWGPVLGRWQDPDAVPSLRPSSARVSTSCLTLCCELSRPPWHQGPQQPPLHAALCVAGAAPAPADAPLLPLASSPPFRWLLQDPRPCEEACSLSRLPPLVREAPQRQPPLLLTVGLAGVSLTARSGPSRRPAVGLL